jgi:signal transduction histidine kinase
MRELFAQLFENYHCAVFLLSLTGELIEMNPVAQQLFGSDRLSEPAQIASKKKEISNLVASQTTRIIETKSFTLEKFITGLGQLKVSFALIESVPDRMVLLTIERVTLPNSILNNELIDQFIYNVSHDLKSPLVTMLGFAELLKEDNYNHLDESTRKCIDYIVSGAKKMEMRLNALLEFTRLTNKIIVKDSMPFYNS